MTKGQRAMAVAKVYPKPKKTGRGKKSSETEDISSGRLSMARPFELPARATETQRQKRAVGAKRRAAGAETLKRRTRGRPRAGCP